MMQSPISSPSSGGRIWNGVVQLRRNLVIQNALWLYAVQISGYALPLITLPYLSRVLSVEKFGLTAFAQSIVWNFGFAMLSILPRVAGFGGSDDRIGGPVRSACIGAFIARRRRDWRPNADFRLERVRAGWR